MSISDPVLNLFMLQVATAICPFKTLVKIFLILSDGFAKHMVRVTSVVPYLY